jgi:hypothetical protein
VAAALAGDCKSEARENRDYVAAGTKFAFELRFFPPHKEITRKVIESLLEYGAYMGFGQFRNGSFGRFTFEIEE